MTRRLLMALLLSCCGLTVQAQSVYDVNHDGKVDAADVTNVVNVIMGKIPDTSAEDGLIDVSPAVQSMNAVTVWKDGVPTVIYSPDNVYLWNTDTYMPGSSDGDAEPAEPTEVEQRVIQLSNDEATVPFLQLSSEDAVKYDAMAEDVIAKFAGKASKTREKALTRTSDEQLDELAQEAIRDNGDNIFKKDLDIFQKDWDSGRWGRTRYAGKKINGEDGEFENFYNTYTDEAGRRCLLIVFYHKGGFPNNKTAVLKLGQVNSGKIIPNKCAIPAGSEYGYIPVCIDTYLDDYGRMTIFPLLLSEVPQGLNVPQPRWYLNPFVVKTKPDEVPTDWQTFGYDKVFGKIDGISVRCNTAQDAKVGITKFNQSSREEDKNQCVELCVRYVMDIYGVPKSKTNGSAHQWPTNRKKETNEDNITKTWIVFPNNGSEQVREGDLIVWQFYKNGSRTGHIGVVIETGKNYIKIAHQNGGAGRNATPIGTYLKIDENRVVRDLMKDGNRSPIYSDSPKPITYFIRKNHSAESEISDYIPKAMKASTVKMDFGKVDVGEEVMMSFTVTNTGFTQALHVSSISLKEGEAFSIDNFSECDIDFDKSRTFKVIFKPKKDVEYKDTIVIKSDAEDNPIWKIALSGTGEGGEIIPEPVPTPVPVPVDDDRFLIHSHEVGGVTYSLYKKTDKVNSHPNYDGWVFYESDLTLDITRNGWTDTYYVGGGVYLDAGANNGQTQCMAIDLKERMIYIFTNSKTSGRDYVMDGYAYVSSLDYINFQRETVFTGRNDGWFPFFVYTNDALVLRHFSYAGYYAKEAVRYSNGSWSNNTVSSISPSNFETRWKANGTLLIIE